MKRYKALSSNSVFRIAGKQYITKEGDILELPEEHVTTQALVERGRLAEWSAPATIAEPTVEPEEPMSVADVPEVAEAAEVADTPPTKPKTTKK